VRILVTGSSGALGSAVASLLTEDDAVGLDVRPGPHTTVVADLRDERAVRSAVAGAAAVVHTASLHAPHVPRHTKREFVDVNVAGTQTVLDAAAWAGVSHVVYSSTTSVYGHALEPRGDAAVWVDEALTPEPRDIYDVTKLAAEELCGLLTSETGISTSCLRVSRFSFEDRPVLAVPYCLHRAVNVTDAARAHVLALSGPNRGHRLLNVSGASPFRREDTPELLHHADVVLRRRAPTLAALLTRHGRPLPKRVARVYAIDRARADLGYEPQHGVAELLAAA